MKIILNLLSFVILLNAIKFAFVYPITGDIDEAKLLLEKNPLIDG